MLNELLQRRYQLEFLYDMDAISLYFVLLCWNQELVPEKHQLLQQLIYLGDFGGVEFVLENFEEFEGGNVDHQLLLGVLSGPELGEVQQLIHPDRLE